MPARSRARAPAQPENLTTVKQAAIALGVSPYTIRRWIAEGLITGWRVGKRRLNVDLDEVRRIMVSPVPAAPPPRKAAQR